MIERPFLLDVTRLIARSWSRRRSTGIDRVCYAYLDHFAPKAQAVVQHRGVFRILTAECSDRLFAMLRGPDEQFRLAMIGFTPQALASAAAQPDCKDAIYLNVGNTDFDLDSHTHWAQACQLRPVYLIHDLIPITHPQFSKIHTVARHRSRVVNALRHGSGVIVNSRSTAAELQCFARREGLPVPSLLTASLAGAELPFPTGPRNSPFPTGQRNSSAYFVCVGTIEARKNYDMLLKVWLRLWEHLGERTPRLVIIGQWGVNVDSVRSIFQQHRQLREYVEVLVGCRDEELGGWVRGAQALLMPTFAEGFGLPVAEALSLGTPVIASDLPCFREIGQGIPLLIDPKDPSAWERALLEFMLVGKEKDRQTRSIRQYRRFTWHDHFSKVDRWFGTLPGRAAESARTQKVAFKPESRGVEEMPRAYR